MNWTEFLKLETERTYATTIRLMEKVDPARLDWKPATGSNWLTMGQLLKHLTEGAGPACRGFLTGDWGLPEGARMEDIPSEEMLPPAERFPAVASVEEALPLMLEDERLTLRMIDLAGEDALANREVEVPWMPGPKLPLGYRLHQMIEHVEHHKSQLFYYLKLQGVPVNTMDLWGKEEASPAEQEHASVAD